MYACESPIFIFTISPARKDEESQGASPRERQVSDSEDGHLETSASAREDELQLGSLRKM